MKTASAGDAVEGDCADPSLRLVSRVHIKSVESQQIQVLYRSYLKLDNEVKAIVRSDPIFVAAVPEIRINFFEFAGECGPKVCRQ